ncbi:uncharacterized protein LOC128806722 [Vidua macroura]|uniref:uncharacterized protein LOC128806722 n=1 Tax=Vidua macroura TaxID=187451 RepID=UPI0023A8EE49|nr:uncharacterized protein LOC128806722 [Vidua macroura]
MAQPVVWRGSRGGIISHPDRWQGSDGPQHHPTAPLGFTPADAWPVAKFPMDTQPQRAGSGRSRRATVNKQKGLFQPPKAIPASPSQLWDNEDGRGVAEEGPERWEQCGKAIRNLSWGRGPGISRTWSHPEQRQNLDLMIPGSPFQLRIFCDSRNWGWSDQDPAPRPIPTILCSTGIVPSSCQVEEFAFLLANILGEIPVFEFLSGRCLFQVFVFGPGCILSAALSLSCPSPLSPYPCVHVDPSPPAAQHRPQPPAHELLAPPPTSALSPGRRSCRILLLFKERARQGSRLIPKVSTGSCSRVPTVKLH